MAARSPSGFTNWLDGTDVHASKIVKSTPMDDALNDMEYLLDAEQMEISFPMRPVSTSSTDWVEIKRFYIKTRDRAGLAAAGDELAEFSFYIWSDGTATPGFRVVSTAGSDNDVDDTIAASTTPAWTPFTHDDFRLRGDGNEDTIIIYFRVDPGGSSGDVWFAGFGLYSTEA